jgi:peptidoglycan hydrolase-like protein with peptidoglycan-binding domain
MYRKLFVIGVLVFGLAVGAFAQGDMKSPGDNKTASSSDEPKRGPIFRPTKDQIHQVQVILKDKKLYSGEATGKYDDETRAGIKVFQKNNGLKETGTLNRATLEKFGVELTESQKKIPVNPNSYAPGDSSSKSSAKSSSKSGDTPASGSSDDKPKRAPVFRATTDQIMAAQKLLKQQSMFDGEATGKFSDEFRDGLRKFQTAKGMKVTGTLNAATLEKMGIELTDNQKKNLEK